MDLKQIRQLLRGGSSVVLVEEGQPPLMVQELRSTGVVAGVASATATDIRTEESEAEVPISSRWPKGRSIHERTQQDQVLERLNKEILALREQIAAEEGAGAVSTQT